ncbi:hypothetical protein DTL21_14770 [Bremerella cremea]|uniref:Uncharacterized protein n=1 Tax=Blastopirellula marina TaxID=124 RepID=A0A2S8FRF1_9BACT|nr:MULTISPECIES: hypothetical protein [Pirellulaceae]PQO34759.1 hypothetical protein C5Y83_14760 [Blastopirellula marina]RCS47258.1 hypothetical protein DTL21_14770 [Bremerella cremea]
MARGCLYSILMVACIAQTASAQSEPRPMPVSGGVTGGANSSLQWRNPGASVPSRPSSNVQPAAFASDPATPPKEGVSSSGTLLKVTSGLKELPNGAGQVWRDYDITPYTSRVTTTAKPEQAIIDWILRETGTDVWFGEPLGMLHANKSTLRVYHTVEMQEVVTEVVTKFVDSQAEVKKLGVRMVTVTSPNWRRLAYRMMQPVSVKTPGIEAWLMSKENAAVLLNELRQRSDFREHHAADLLVHNGQSSTISMLQPRTFVRGVRATQTFPGYELQSDQIEEGFAMEVSPLLTPDDKMIDAVLKCSVDQIEKFVTVDVDVPTSGTRQAVDIQIPQMVSWRLHERFRWPSDQVLLISCGVVARPQAGIAGTAPQLPSLAGLLPERPPRADGLMFVEFKGDAKTGAGQPVRSAQPAAVDSRGRY